MTAAAPKHCCHTQPPAQHHTTTAADAGLLLPRHHSQLQQLPCSCRQPSAARKLSCTATATAARAAPCTAAAPVLPSSRHRRHSQLAPSAQLLLLLHICAALLGLQTNPPAPPPPPPPSPSFLTSFLFLLSFLRSSTLRASTPMACACSQCFTSPSTHTFMAGRGM